MDEVIVQEKDRQCNDGQNNSRKASRVSVIWFNVIMPKTIKDIGRIRNETYQEMILPCSDYFKKVGNLVTKTLIRDREYDLFCTSYFSFIGEESEVFFDIDRRVVIDKLVWMPSEKKIFSCAYDIAVEVMDEKKQVVERCLLKKRDIDIIKGIIDIPLHYEGICSVIHIRAKLIVYKSFKTIYGNYYDKAWREEFWRKWFVITKEKKILKSISGNSNHSIWIYGCAQIAQAIASYLRELGIESVFVTSEGRVNNKTNVLSISNALKTMEIPSMIIITAMNDYELIMYQLPKEVRNKAYRLNVFLDLFLA